MTLICGRRLMGLVFCGWATSACGFGGPPSDAAMISHLRAERAAFDAVVTMMAEDGIVGELVVDAVPADSPERRARRERYRVHAKRTGCSTIVRGPDGSVWFNHRYLTSGGGVAGTGFTEYVYSPKPPSRIRQSLDEGGLERFEETFRHVDGAWYLCRTPV
jgi:hypothetical protein